MIGQGKQEWGKEEGAALLTVLLLVAVISVLAMSALDKLTIATRLAGNMSAMDQSRAYAQAGELVAASRIASIAQVSPGRTTLAGGWMGKPMPFPIDGGKAWNAYSGSVFRKSRNGGPSDGWARASSTLA